MICGRWIATASIMSPPLFVGVWLGVVCMRSMVPHMPHVMQFSWCKLWKGWEYLGWVQGEVMDFDEIQIWVKGRAIIFPSQVVYSLSQGDCSLSEEVFVCPGLPGMHRRCDHFWGAPSSSWGGRNDDMVISGTYCCASKKFLCGIPSMT